MAKWETNQWSRKKPGGNRLGARAKRGISKWSFSFKREIMKPKERAYERF